MTNRGSASKGDGQAPLLFYSYAHKDEVYLTRLRVHLALLKRENKISEWYDRKINPGDLWDNLIKQQLERARVILLLISANFIASDYCWGIEVGRALEKNARNEAIVVPVILSPVDWHSAPFGMLQALPTNAKPITTWGNRDEAWADVAAGIRLIIERIARAALPAPCGILTRLSTPEMALSYWPRGEPGQFGLNRRKCP